MLDVILQMAGLVVCGVVWRHLKPGGLHPGETRKVLTTFVYYLLLPALVLSVLWRTDIGLSSFRIAGIAALGVLLGIGLALVTCRVCRNRRPETGAIILAIAFPNATYLGLPVLEATFGPQQVMWSRSIAIQYDLFACTPLLFTLGILIASRFGSSEQVKRSWYQDLVKIPALWAALVALILNLSNVAMPEIVKGFLSLLDRGVAPLMLFSIGLSLHWSRERWQTLPALIPVVVYSLFLIPLVVYYAAGLVGMTGELHAAVVMEAAMPSMVFGIVLCDRFNLDSALYAAAVTLTTALSIVTLPLWHAVLL
ncbi:MAG: AEC family transporter [Gammaproteobacteria bacterium]|jgi:malate permease and related proteins